MLEQWLLTYVVLPALLGTVVAVLMYWLARWTPIWAVASGSAMAALCWSSSWQSALPPPYPSIAAVVLAVVFGVFFFIGARRQGRRFRVALLGAVIAFVAAGAFTYPIKTHAVRLDMPSPNGHVTLRG